MYISVIITCYNLEAYIGEAISSVIAQDADSLTYEIIVVDDCSTDSSAKVIQSFPMVKYIRTPINQGVLSATIMGIQNSKGDIISFLDGDDVWRSDKLSRVAARFSGDDTLIFLTHNYRFMDEGGKDKAGLEYTQNIFNNKDRNQVSQLIINGILQRKNYVWLGSAYSIRLRMEDISSFINWVNNLPNPRLTYQDWPLAFWIAASCYGRFGYDREKLFSYRIHSANFSGDSNSLEKAIRNWSKAYYTSLGLLDIANRFSCKEVIKSICHSAVVRDELVLSLFQNPTQLIAMNYFTRWRCFGSFRNWSKETIRMLMIKFFGLRSYFYIKNRISR